MKFENIESAPLLIIMQHLVHLSKFQMMHLQERFNLKPSQAGVLFTLHCNGKLSQRELAEKTGVTPPSMTVTLRKMEDMGYITKEPDINDQRIIRIMLTEKGAGCVGNIKAVASHMEDIMFQNISAEEKLLLRRILLQMKENLMNSRDFKDVDMRDMMKHIHDSH